MSGLILGEILAAKRRRIAAGEFTAETGARTRAEVAAGAAGRPDAPPDGARFAFALSSSSNSLSKQNPPLPLLLAEIKHRSPSAGLILPDAPSRIESVARAYRRGGASALSVVVERNFFAGDPSWLPRAKAASGLPALMKDFVVGEGQVGFAAAPGGRGEGRGGGRAPAGFRARSGRRSRAPHRGGSRRRAPRAVACGRTVPLS